jgi:hypothetical protein
MEAAELAHLRRARDLLDREYARPLDVPTMARAALMSPSLFSRRFREAYGDTPAGAGYGSRPGDLFLPGLQWGGPKRGQRELAGVARGRAPGLAGTGCLPPENRRRALQPKSNPAATQLQLRPR